MNTDQLSELSRIPNVHVTTAPAQVDAAREDFGHLCSGDVMAVVRPLSAEGLRSVIVWANKHHVSLTARGMGLSQSGQSIPMGGLSLDLGALREIHVSPELRTVRCGAGATWREVLAKTVEYGLAPAVTPLNLDLSVGGVLSAGGYGSTSHEKGLGVSNVESCSVVTGAGECVECSWTERPEVFHAVLGGAGYFGAIDHAVVRLRPLAPFARTFTLLYDDFAACLADHRDLKKHGWATHLEGFCTAAIQGLRRAPQGGRRIPFARWFYGLHVTVEHEEGAAPSADVLKGLNFREVVLVDDDDSHAFAGRYDARFEGMRRMGVWNLPHPWLECMLPYDVALEVIPRLVEELPIFLGDGHRVSLLADVPRPELFVAPTGEPIVTFAMVPVGIVEALKGPALAALREAHETLLRAGGKRYLSGWLFEPDEAAWRLHWGERFEVWRARKAALDPAGVFSSRLMTGG